MKMSKWLAIVVVTVLAVLPGPAQGAAFLKIEGVQGGATAPHAGWIELSSYSLGSGLPAHAGSGAGGATRTRYGASSVSFTTQTNKASAKLMMASGLGEHFPSATLEVTKSPADPEPALRYEMTDVFVSSYHAASLTGGSMSPESFSLNFARVEIEYKESKTGSIRPGRGPIAGLPPAVNPAPSSGGGQAQAARVNPTLPGTILAVKVQPAVVNAGATVTITVEGSGECKFAWIDFGDHSQPQAQLFASPFPKTFTHAFATPGTFTVVAWGYDPDSPKQRSEAKAGTCVGLKKATVQIRSLAVVAPALKK